MALISALAARTPMWSADLFTLSLPDATTYYWTSADQDVTANGHVFSALGPAIERSTWAAKNTTEVPTMDIQLYSTGLDFGTGNNIKFQMHAGLLDGAYMLLERVFMPVFGDTTLGTVVLFGGLVGEIQITSLGAKITCTASNVQLEQNLPRRTYQATCMHTLYDQYCTLDRSAFTASYVVSAANAIAINWVSGSGPADPSTLLFGTMTITSGAGAGQALTVNGYSSAGVGFGYPLLTIPAPGDSFTVSQGCAKTVARCVAFGNALNFGGFPYIPVQSTGL